ncbi:MAG: DUF58 domain-containing protein [Candidatus Eremiobacteraeota bacterium]|nr:DUF58 domain-containing protein [Candidatus Eremiobacteraeota bacterium]MCW5872822.1 DUF58 domain-containing protein [Candidatus Eremiobacteraeota bacterium]
MKIWLHRYLTAGGRVMWGAALVSLAAGLDPYRGQLSGLFVMSAGLTMANFLVGLLMIRRLGGEMRLPARAVAGTEVKVTVLVSNRSRHSTYDVEATLPGLGSARDSRRSHLAPGQQAGLDVHFRALKRGAYRIGPAYAGSTYPLGIVRLSQRIGQAQTLLVTPRIHPMRNLRLHSGMRHQPGGLPLASQQGESLEFVGVRDYRPGDSPRKIHWKLFARRNQPVVREFAQEYFSRIGILLDTYRPPKAQDFEAALETVASLASFLERSDSVVDFFAAGEILLSMGRNQGSLEGVLETLACLKSTRRSPYAQLEARLEPLIPRLSALLLVTFAPTPERRAFWERLSSAGTPVRILCLSRKRPESDQELTWIHPDQLAAGLDDL